MRTYITIDGSLTVPDESERPLQSYHNVIRQRLDSAELIGLTGKDNGIRRLVVSEELSDSDKSNLEDYLKTEIQLAEPDS